MKIVGLICLAAALVAAGEFPQAEISNKLIKAKLYLPDPDRGYYRGTRFDWSGAVASLEYKGHNFFGPWFERHDPKIHDAITGPVEEFLTNGAGLGYAEAEPGDIFIRIGVGRIRKPAEPEYRRFGTYDILDPGKWTINRGADQVEFIHEIEDPGGYAYVYRKTMRLEYDKPRLILEHSLKNTGRRLIATDVYNHNFFVIDGQPSGPDARVQFRFPLRGGDLGGRAEIRDKELRYLKELKGKESVFTELTGFGSGAKDYDVRVEHRKAGAGVRITGNRPLSKLVFWSVRSTVCPEPYIHLRIEPGREVTWRIAYDFYTLEN